MNFLKIPNGNLGCLDGFNDGLNEVNLSTDGTTVHFTLTALCTVKINRHPAIS